MKTLGPQAVVLPPRADAPGQNAFGQFSPDGSEYCITDPRTPRPWSNIISNPRMGLAVTQTGSGFTWIDNSQLAVITRWQQEFAQDSSGKFLYLRDTDSGRVWSLSPAPVWAAYSSYECRHGLGYTVFATEFDGIRAEWTLFVHPVDTIEFWRVELHNLTDQVRRLELCAYLEWNCGVAPAPRREFQKLFIETEFDPAARAIFARSHMWEVPSERFGHWNADFPYISALACTERILSAQGDKAAFLGRYGDLRSPAALQEELWKIKFGRHDDPIAALRSSIELAPGQSRRVGYAVAAATSRDELTQSLARNLRIDAMDRALSDVRADWKNRLAAHRIETPEPTLNYLLNDWVRYQAISGRIWGRCGYYQQSGAFGFRDQLQDSQIWLTIDPQRCREQLKLHAAHQFADGSVYHWWHPLSEQGHVTKMTDDLLWLAFVSANYIRETGDVGILDDASPYLDDERPASLIDHVMRAFERVFKRTSARGLPFIGAGDWNDGLSACGLQERGESVWLGQFLVGLLADWAEILRRAANVGGARSPNGDGAARRNGEPSKSAASLTTIAADFDGRRNALIAAINEHAWDGRWYMRATLDDGSKLGCRENRVGRIFLNAQTWAVLNDVATPQRAAACMAAVKEHLVSKAGPLLLTPAFDRPVEEIGYITRYAPGMRENGGVYTHAATWAIAAACKMRDAELVGRLLTALNPALKDPEAYWAEPYVLPGNIDGPDSPHYGRAGWTWYTGSAQWLQRVVAEWVLGVRPEWDGLRIDPCLPPGWQRATMVRPWRGCVYEVQIARKSGTGSERGVQILLDGAALESNLVPVPKETGKRHEIRVSFGG